jgi:hypothetical protein
MKFYKLRRPVYFRNYGTVLVDGLAGDPFRQEGRFILQRTGPFMPPFTKPAYCHEIIVSDAFRLRLLDAFPNLEFREVIKQKVVEIHWEQWDRDAEPVMYPPGPEEDDYLNVGDHSPEAAEALGPLWELVLREGARSTSRGGAGPADFDLIVDESTWNGDHFFVTLPARIEITVVSDVARQWLLKEVPEWVAFRECKNP